MLKFLNINFLLKLIYKLAKFSGLIFITINFNSVAKVEKKKQFLNVIIFIVSFGFSLTAYSFDARLPVAYVTRSQLLEIGINLIFPSTIWCLCILKLSTLFNSEAFFNIISNLQWGERKVSFILT